MADSINNMEPECEFNDEEEGDPKQVTADGR
jgi:hypothetical protein